MHTSVRRIALAALALPLLLAGCADDDPVPKIPDTSTPTASVTETSDPVEPTLPPEAEGKGNEAAEAFVRYYYETVDYAQATGDTNGLRMLAGPECDACRGGADAIDEIDGQRGTIEGGKHTVDSCVLTGRRGVPGEGAIYYATVRVSHTDQVVQGTKKLDGNYGAGSDELRFELVRGETGWLVSEWFEP